MTTLIAWAGVDHRAVSSIYIASDSRITWGNSHKWNQGRKTFASSTTPHIFGYWGDVLFPALAIPTLLDEISAGAVRRRGSAFGSIGDALRRLWRDYPSQEHRDFGLVVATRRRERMDSVFELAVITFEASSQTWDTKEIAMPGKSARLHLAGSGAREVRATGKLWEESAQGGTSRSVYSSFAEALRGQEDPYSGGAPQLVGLHRIGNGMRFGTVHDGKRFISGARVTQRSARVAGIQWFNDLFERVDGGRASRLVDAKKHHPR